MICNEERCPTFRNASRTSYIDVIMCSASMSQTVVDWRTEQEKENFSPYFNTHFTVKRTGNRGNGQDNIGRSAKGWNIKSLGEAKLHAAIEDMPKLRTMEVMER